MEDGVTGGERGEWWRDPKAIVFGLVVLVLILCVYLFRDWLVPSRRKEKKKEKEDKEKVKELIKDIEDEQKKFLDGV